MIRSVQGDNKLMRGEKSDHLREWDWGGARLGEYENQQTLGGAHKQNNSAGNFRHWEEQKNPPDSRRNKKEEKNENETSRTRHSNQV